MLLMSCQIDQFLVEASFKGLAIHDAYRPNQAGPAVKQDYGHGDGNLL
jgi:hypothetical protein